MSPLKIILQSKVFYISIIIFTFLYVFISVNIIKYKSIYNQNDNKFIGEVKSYKVTDYGYSLTFKSQENLIVYTKEFKYNLGDKLLIEGTLEKPKNNTIFNDFNYKEYLYQNKIYYILNANSITLLKENTNLIYKVKNFLVNYINKFKSNIYLYSFILGDTSYLNDLYDSYQINGICHLLSIGSTHITLLSTIILFLFKKIKINDYISYIVLFIIILLFIILTNYPISIIRTYLYLILSFLNTKIKLNLKPLNIFMLTTFITLLLNPFYIYHKGFLYSYFISFILILNKDKIIGNYFIKLVKISFISFLASIPFNIYFNYSLNLISIIANLLYVPCFNIIIFPLTLLTLFIPIFDNLLFQIMELLNQISYFLNNYTMGIFILKKINIIVLIIYLIIIIYIINTIFNKKKHGLIILIILLVIHFNINKLFNTNFYITLDVKQGDSSLLYLNNQAVLIDTGGIYKQDISEKIINMLYSFGINKLDYLVLTHGDYDHMGEAINLINKFKVEKVIFNCGEFNELEQKLIKVLDEKKIKYQSCINELNINNNKLYFLQTKEYDNENDNSSVIYTELNNHKFLFMGDAGVGVEEDLIKKYHLKDIDVLKVGHHGSKTSSGEEFIDEINPKYSIISVGKNNRYGHPNQEVLNVLEDTKIYRTDQDGSIMFKIKNNKLEIETCEP